jgi:hypothetical protein
MNEGEGQKVFLQLCDDDGVVRRGALHDGVDYECTRHAHFDDLHIICNNPVHIGPEAVYEREYMRWEGGE